jgi:hypothetical protein
MATPLLLDFGEGVAELLAEPVGDDEDVVVAIVVLVVLALLAVYVAEGSMVVTINPAAKVKTAEGSEQLHPLNP